MVKTQVIADRDGKPAYAVIPWALWQRLRPYAEVASDKALFDAALARQAEAFPAAPVNALLDGANPIKTLRDYRGLTQAALAKAAGIGALYVSQIETGRRTGSLASLRALAKALDVDFEMIAPTK